MAAKDLGSELSRKAFLMYLPPKGKNQLSVNSRLVFSYLFYRRKFKKGSSLAKIGEFLGMAAHHGVKSAIDELKSLNLVVAGENFQWFAAENRPGIFARRGFIPVYMLKESKGGRLTNTDNVMLWVLHYLGLPGAKWKWPKNRSAVLANFVGIESRNVKRHIKKLQSMNLVTHDWHVNTCVIDPDWYRSPKEDETVEPYVPMPETGNRWVDEVLMSVELITSNEGMERHAIAEFIRGLIRSGCLSRIRSGRHVFRAKDSLTRHVPRDVPSFAAAIEAALSKWPDTKQPEPESSVSPAREIVEETPVASGILGDDGDIETVLNLEELSLGQVEDCDFLIEGVTDDLVASLTSTI